MLKRKIVAMVLSVSLIVSMIGIGTATVLQTKTNDTSGGTNGYVTIRSQVYKNQEYIYSGVYKYTYGLKSNIQDVTTVTTNFTMTGNIYNSAGYPTAINKSGNVNSMTFEKTSDNSSAYSHIVCTVKTNSTAFGNSSQSMSAAF